MQVEHAVEGGGYLAGDVAIRITFSAPLRCAWRMSLPTRARMCASRGRGIGATHPSAGGQRRNARLSQQLSVRAGRPVGDARHVEGMRLPQDLADENVRPASV